VIACRTGHDGQFIARCQGDGSRPLQHHAIVPGIKAPAGQADPALPALQSQPDAGHGDFNAAVIGASQRAGQAVGHTIHGSRCADAMTQLAEPAGILHRGQGPGAGYGDDGAHGAAVKLTRSPGDSWVGGSAAGSKFLNSVLPMTCQPVGSSVAVIAVCPAANNTVPAGTIGRTSVRRGSTSASACSPQ